MRREDSLVQVAFANAIAGSSIGKIRLERDIEDTVKIINRLQNVSPLDGIRSLMNTVNGR